MTYVRSGAQISGGAVYSSPYASQAGVDALDKHTDGWVNVATYLPAGYVPGVTDATAAINSALNSGAKDVFVPAGIYVVTGRMSITYGGGFRLRGAGKNTTILRWAIDSADADKFAMLLDANVTISDMTIENVGTDVTNSIGLVSQAGAANGFHDSQVYRGIVKGFGVGLGSSQGLSLGMMFNDIFESMDFINCETPIMLGVGSNNTRFVKCSISGTTGNRMVRLNNASTITFDGVAFEPFDASVVSGALIAAVELSPNVAFLNCYYEPSYGLYFDSSPGFVVDNSLVESFDFTVGSLSSNAHVRATDASNAGTFAVPMRGLVRGTVCRSAANPANSYVAVDDNANTVTTVDGFATCDANLKDSPPARLYPAWTPTLAGTGGGTAHTYAQRYGYSYRIGNLVSCFFRVSLSAKDATMTGPVSIAGLPHPAATLTMGGASGALSQYKVDLSAGYSALGCEVVSAGSSAQLVQLGDSVSPIALDSAGVQSDTLIVGSVSYFTDAL